MNAGASTSAVPSPIEGSGSAWVLLGAWALSPARPTPIHPRHECRGFSALLVRKNQTMTIQRRQHSGAFKAKVALEAIRGERPVNELAADYGVHPVQITQWKRVALEALPDIFSSRRGAKHKDEETLKATLYQQIGQLKVELDWLKKKAGLVR